MGFSGVATLIDSNFQQILGIAERTVPSVIDQIFTRGKMDGPIEESLMIETYGMPDYWEPGTTHTEISAGTSYSLRSVIGRYGAKTTFIKEWMDEDPTRTVLKLAAAKAAAFVSLYMSFREYSAATWLATGFVGTSGLPTIDGYPMFYASHPKAKSTPSDTYSNHVSGDPALNPTSLQNAINLFSVMTMANGWQLLEQKPSALLAHDTNYQDVMLTLQSPMDPRLMTNTPNTSRDWGIKPILWGYFRPEPSSSYDGSSGATYPGWVLQTTKNGLDFKTLNGFTSDSDLNKDTHHYTVYTNDDFMMQNTDPRIVVGSLGG